MHFGAISLGLLAVDAIPVVAYYLWILATALFAGNPFITLEWFAIDAIFLVIFCIAYIAGVNSTSEAISHLMLFSALVVWISAFYFSNDHSVRFGLRAYEVAPFIIPFAIAGIYQGSRWSWLSLILTMAFLVASQSRAHFAAGLVILGLSVFWMAPRFGTAFRVALLLALSGTCVGLAALQFEPVQFVVARSWSRLAGVDVVVSGQLVEGKFADQERAHINEISGELLAQYDPLGIGYQNFGEAYGRYYRDLMPLHSIYSTWAIELGIVGVALVLFILTEFGRRLRIGIVRSRNLSETNFWKALGLGLVVALLTGLFHQAHESPGFWTILGLAWGSAHRLVRARKMLRQPADVAAEGIGSA